MADLGRLEFVIRSGAGQALSGVSVEIRPQGASIQSGGPNSFTVDAPNGLVAGMNTRINTSTSPTRAVSSVAATNVTVGAGGFSGTADDDRITAVDNLPSLFADAQGNEAKSNPLTTDSAGRAWAYLVGGAYDVLTSGGGADTRLFQDQIAVGGHSIISNIFTTGSAIGYKFNTLRTLVGNDKLVTFQHAGSEVFNLKPAGATVTGTLTATGALTVGSFASPMTVGRIYGRNGTVVDSGDFTVSAGWGATASIAVSALSTDTRGFATVTCSGAGIAANPFITFTYADGTFGQAPIFTTTRHDLAAPLAASWNVDSTSDTSTRFYFTGTPVNGSNYSLAWTTLG